LRLTAEQRKETFFLHLILNACRELLEFELPTGKRGAGSWRRWIDTALDRLTTSPNRKKHHSFRPKHIQPGLARYLCFIARYEDFVP
jgi:hypothetical protein